MQPSAPAPAVTRGGPTRDPGPELIRTHSEASQGSSASKQPLPKRKSSKTAAEKDDDDGGAGGGDKASNQKRRRRVFSCQSCQRLKCRCEYDPGSQACHRCMTLRIECSLKGEMLDIPQYSKPLDSGASSSIEERLDRQEKSLVEIKGMIEAVSRQFGLSGSLSRSPIAPLSGLDNAENDLPVPTGGDEGPEHLADTVELGSKSAPTVVLREIGEQVTKGYRRLEHVKLDLVQLQLLDEQVAHELVQLFMKHHSQLLLVYDPNDPSTRDMRQVSAFLHSVCCLCAILYREDICGTGSHRQIYEQVRISLGQTLLSSPLSLEEINAVLIMSDHADGPEYIDSWLLTGYCVKQAMLSISFSKIVDNIKRGSTTIQDRRAILLWSTICLHHLHWAATTGRPSVLHTPYIHQCNILLNFYQASMQDGMLVAETLLYSTLHQKLAKRSYLDDVGECEEFRQWKQRWNHLMSLPTASMLRIGYYAAHLILAVRALEESGNAMSPTTFLANFDGAAGATEAGDDSAPSKNSTHTLHTHALKNANSVLETFVGMKPFEMDSIPTYLLLCIGYCALVLAHFDESQSKISSNVTLALIAQLEDWCMRTPSKSWAIKFAKLARDKVQLRVERRSHADPRKSANRDRERRHLPGWSGSDNHNNMSPFPLGGSVNQGSTPTTLTDARSYDSDDYAPPPPAPGTFALETDTIHHAAGFEVAHQVIPSMEDFFGGGFLDYMRQPRP